MGNQMEKNMESDTEIWSIQWLIGLYELLSIPGLPRDHQEGPSRVGVQVTWIV